jgi:polyhydroxybutyrate depolymerase
MKEVFLLFSVLVVTVLNAQTATTVVDSIYSSGDSRTYRLYVPDAVASSSNKVPLVFCFHGYGNSATKIETRSGFNLIADTAHFIVVYPQALAPFGKTMWYNFFSPDATAQKDVDFVSNLIDSLGVIYNIDESRIYSTGFSNGGFMTYALACQLSNRIAAAASVAGSVMPSHLAVCDCEHPMPIMQIHGTADSTVTYNGVGSITPTNSLHIDSLVDYWVNFNNCNLTPSVTNLPNISIVDSCTVEHHVYSGGNAGAVVEFYKIIGGAHEWPSLTASAKKGRNQDFDASSEIWRFFSTKTLILDVPNKANRASVLVYPNPSYDRFSIRIENREALTLTVYNMLGKVVLRVSNVITELTFSLQGKPAGLYSYTLSSTSGEIIKSGKLSYLNQ